MVKLSYKEWNRLSDGGFLFAWRLVIGIEKRIKCPYCGYKMPLSLALDAESKGVFAICKGRNCGKIFEIKVKKGVQIDK